MMPLSHSRARRGSHGAVVLAIVAACASTSLEGCAAAVGSRSAPAEGDSTLALLQIRRILEAHWTWLQAHSPTTRVWAGLGVEQLLDVSLDAAKANASFGRAAVRALDGVRIDALPQDLYVSWLALGWDMSMLSRTAAFYWTDLSTIAPENSPLRVSLDALHGVPIADGGDAQRYLYLVEQYAQLVDSIRGGLAARAARGIVLPRLVLPRAARFARSLIARGDSGPFTVSSSRLHALTGEANTQFRLELATALALRLHPALERLSGYLEGEYAARASDQIGLGQFVGGKEYYRHLVRHYSTLDITPEEAHAAGLRDLRRLDSLATAARLRSALPGTRDSLRAHLHSHPRYAVKDPVDVLDRMLAEYARAAVVMGKAFTRSPEVSVDVQSMPAELEDLAPLMLYAPPSVLDPQGHYLFNAARWKERSLLTTAGRVYEDLLPGRHYQAARQRENVDLPGFRRVAYHAGLVDGWSAYAVALADSLGAGQDEESRFGALIEQVAIASGLVVDTGINYFGWTREETLTFLRGRLPDSDAELEREFIIPAVESPGSLTAAALGARELRGLHRWARQELGNRFDLRSFHDQILSLGSVPLPVLGKHLEWWLWHEKTKAVVDTSRSTIGPQPPV